MPYRTERGRSKWSHHAADQTDQLRAVYGLVHELLLVALATRNALQQLDNRFAAAYEKELEIVRAQTADEHAVAEHLLKKAALVLRGDPAWQDE